MTHDNKTALSIVAKQTDIDRGYNEKKTVDCILALLQPSCGCTLPNVNMQDNEGDTPLHIFCRSLLSHNLSTRRDIYEVINILVCEFGAHVDIYNNQGVTPRDFWFRVYQMHQQEYPGLWYQPEYYRLVKAINLRFREQSLSLSCHCARTILKHKIPYENHLPTRLVQFVHIHGSKGITEPLPIATNFTNDTITNGNWRVADLPLTVARKLASLIPNVLRKL